MRRSRAAVYVERIDETHANAKRAWREMGEPEYLSARRGGIARSRPRAWRESRWIGSMSDGVVHLDLELAAARCRRRHGGIRVKA